MSDIVARAFALIDLLANAEKPLRLMEIVEKTGLDKSTVHRILRSLTARDFLARDPDTLRYRVGPAFMTIAAGALSRFDLCVVARPYLSRLVDLTGETVSLHLRVGHDRVCLDGVESQHEVRSIQPTGERRPLHRGITGRVILAYLSEQDAAAIRQLAQSEGDNLEELDTQLKHIRALGGFWGISDRLPDVGVLSVPIFMVNEIAGSLTVSGPCQRCTGEQLEGYFPQVQEVAKKISAELGSDRRCWPLTP